MKKILLVVSCLMMVFVESGMTKNRIIVSGDPKLELGYKKGEMLDVPLYARTVPTSTRMSQTIAGQAIPSSYFLDLRGANTLDNEQRRFTADWLVAHDNSSPWQTTGLAVIDETNDVGLAGPIVGGRDQAAAFSDGWVYFFIIYNPLIQDISSLSSESPISPTLPEGYTQFVRVGSSRYSAGAQYLYAQNQIGEKTWLAAAGVVFTNGKPDVADEWKLADLSTHVPPTAKIVWGTFGLTDDTTNPRAMGVGTDTGGNGQVVAGFPAATVHAAYEPTFATHFEIPLATPQTIYWTADVTQEKFGLFIHGYVDDL